MKIFFALITFVVFCYQCESVELECEYNITHSGIYQCVVQNDELITLKDDRDISSIKGQHKYGRSDVTGFRSRGKVVKFFPRGLTKFYKKIEIVEISNAGLEEVSKEDLKEFGGKLKYLYLDGNKIEKIDSDLFEFNPNLKQIDLGHNKIKHIGSGAFNGLEDLRYFDLNDNPCTGASFIEDYDYRDRFELRDLIDKKVEGICKDLNATTIEPELAETTEDEPETTPSE